MELDTAIRTVIENSPGIKAEFLTKEVEKMTGKSRSTIYAHLTSLVFKHDIYRDKGHYYPEPPAGARRRAKEKHKTKIISGLLVLAERGKYTPPGGIVPDPRFAEYASQHLKSGYSSISSLESIDKKLFVQRVLGLIEALKLGDEKLRGRCEDCQRRI